MVPHAGGNVLAAFDLFARGRSEWQASTTPQPLIWDTGADASFWISLAAAIIAGAAAVWAYTALADVVRKSPAPAAETRSSKASAVRSSSPRVSLAPLRQSPAA